jgi:hypothetical protein
MDLNPAILISAVLLPAILGWLAAAYLRPALVPLLTDLCGSCERAAFWTRMASLGMVIGPTALALMRAEQWLGSVAAVAIIRSLLSVSLNGVLVVLGVLALAMWRQIPRGTSGTSNREAA